MKKIFFLFIFICTYGYGQISYNKQLATPVTGANGGTGIANTGSTITLGGSVITTGTATPTLAFPSTARTFTYPNIATKVMGYTSGTNTGSGNILFISATGTTVTTAEGTDNGFFTWNGSDCIVQDQTTTSTNGFQTKSNNGGSGKLFSYGASAASPTGTSITTGSMTGVSSTTSLVLTPTSTYYNIIGTTASNNGNRLDAAGMRIGRIDNLQNAATARLQIDAGTTTAGTAPFKLTISGSTVLTTIEAGAVETNTAGVLFYSPTSSNRFQLATCLTATATIDIGNTTALTSTTTTVTLPGAALSDIVDLGLPNGSVPASPNLFNYVAWVSATDVVSLTFFNNNAITAIDPASGTYKFTIIKN